MTCSPSSRPRCRPCTKQLCTRKNQPGLRLLSHSLLPEHRPSCCPCWSSLSDGETKSHEVTSVLGAESHLCSCLSFYPVVFHETVCVSWERERERMMPCQFSQSHFICSLKLVRGSLENAGQIIKGFLIIGGKFVAFSLQMADKILSSH